MNRPFRVVTVSGLAFAALGMVAVAALWQNARLSAERRTLRNELAILRGEPLPQGSNEEVKTAARIADLARQLAEETALLKTTEAQLIALQKAVSSAEGEELRSFGHVEEMGREAAQFPPLIAEFAKKVKERRGGKLSDEEWASIGVTLVPWMNRLAAIGDLEENPAEIARFHASSLQARLALDEPTTAKLRSQVQREFEQIKGQGLARPERPEREQAEWYRRRKQALDDASVRIEALIPVEQRQPNAVEQSLHLGTGMRTNSHVGPDGQGTISMGFDLPGIDLNP